MGKLPKEMAVWPWQDSAMEKSFIATGYAVDKPTMHNEQCLCIRGVRCLALVLQGLQANPIARWMSHGSTGPLPSAGHAFVAEFVQVEYTV